MKRVTARKKFSAKLNAFKEWLKRARTLKTKELWKIAKAKLRGHYNYYGVTDNLRGIVRFGEEVKKLLFKWLNRRGNVVVSTGKSSMRCCGVFLYWNPGSRSGCLDFL